MTNQHPITPPPELVEKWHDDWLKAKVLKANVKHVNFDEYISTKAARWGADQELEACCEWMLANARFLDAGWIKRLRAARRPKPQSLKEQALNALAEADGADYPVVCTTLTADQHALIRRALEALPDAD